MTEILAVPAWDDTGTPLSAWVEQFTTLGLDAVVTRESTGVSWIEVNSVRLRGYAVMEGRNVEAINFELTAVDPLPARTALEQAAAVLRWDLAEDDEDAGEPDDD